MSRADTTNELLQRVCADASDIEARLVYADWLSEQGDPRGEFIAGHCQLERMGALDDGYPELLANTERLEAAHRQAWFQEYLQRQQDHALNPVFRHGFLHRVAMEPEAIEREWDWLRQREPIQGIELLLTEYLPDQFHGLTQPAAFRTLALNPSGWFTANSIADVLRWGMPLLEELDLSGCDAGVAGCQLLANLDTDLGEYFDDYVAPPPLPRGQLKSLRLRGCGARDAGVQLLLNAETLSAVTQLDIGQNRLSDAETLRALKRSPQLRHVERLFLAGNKELAGHFDELAGWERLPALSALSLPSTLTLAELQALFPRASSNLRELDLSSAKELLSAPLEVAGVAERLTHLNVGTTRLGDKGFAKLLSAPSVHTLVDLRAGGCSLSDKALTLLADSELQRLVKLDLSSNKLTDAGAEKLAQWPGLRHVTFFRIGNNRKLTLQGYQALMKSPYLEPTVFDIGKATAGALTESLRERYGPALRVSG